MNRSRASIALAAITALLTPSVAHACPVCFGSAHSVLLDSARLGVLAMVGVTLAVLGAFAAFFLRLRRLANTAEAAPEPSLEAQP